MQKKTQQKKNWFALRYQFSTDLRGHIHKKVATNTGTVTMPVTDHAHL
jgi:hypothetical protein